MLNTTELATNQNLLKVTCDKACDTNQFLIKELNLLEDSNLAISYFNLSKNNKNKSIIYKAIKYIIRNYHNDRENIEDLVSEALMLLKIASEKFLETKREINFEQFAITYVRENIKKYRSKINGLNGSDKNELIHTAIKIIKNNNQRPYGRLKFSEIKKIVDHFNLDKKKGFKKVWELESIHLEKKPLWIKDSHNEDKEICIIDDLKNKVSISNFLNENKTTIDVLIDLENKENIKKIIKKFFVNLNEQEKIIFQKRIFNEKDCYEKLKDISQKLNISIQRINKIENNLKIKLKDYFIVENKKLTGIK